MFQNNRIPCTYTDTCSICILVSAALYSEKIIITDLRLKILKNDTFSKVVELEWSFYMYVPGRLDNTRDISEDGISTSLCQSDAKQTKCRLSYVSCSV